MPVNYYAKILTIAAIFVLLLMLSPNTAWSVLVLCLFFSATLLFARAGNFNANLTNSINKLRSLLPFPPSNIQDHGGAGTGPSHTQRLSSTDTGQEAPEESKEETKKKQELARTTAKRTLEELIGIDGAINTLNELVTKVEGAKDREQTGFGIHASAIVIAISGPDGTGKTTIAETLADLFFGFGALPSNNRLLLNEIDLRDTDARSTITAACSQIGSGVIVFDDIDWVSSYAAAGGRPSWLEIGNALSRNVKLNPNQFLVVLTGSENEVSKTLQDASNNKWLGELHIVRMQTTNLQEEDLLSILVQLLRKKGWDTGDGFESKALRAIREQKRQSSQSFDNVKAIRKLADILMHKATISSTASGLSNTISADVFEKLKEA
jgi:hypothetical protein